MAGWLTAHGYDAPHRDAVLSYVGHESGYETNVVTRTGACLFQWAGARRRRLMDEYGRCPSWWRQMIFADHELRNVRAYRCFWTGANPAGAMKRGFGGGHC